jgi:hypothetical protein
MIEIIPFQALGRFDLSEITIVAMEDAEVVLADVQDSE